MLFKIKLFIIRDRHNSCYERQLWETNTKKYCKVIWDKKKSLLAAWHTTCVTQEHWQWVVLDWTENESRHKKWEVVDFFVCLVFILVSILWKYEIFVCIIKNANWNNNNNNIKNAFFRLCCHHFNLYINFHTAF